jgi:hypothetical protein
MNALTLLILFGLVFWTGWLGHWISAKEQRRQLKRYKALMAELGQVIPARMTRQPQRKRKNGR